MCIRDSPCGPCSEIFYDHGDHLAGGLPGTKDQDGDRYIEIWNLVFMQFEQISKEKRITLPKPSVDTGMGLERITALLQGTHDNYKSDHFKKLIESISDTVKVKADENNIASFRVIADHLRASSFLLAEGVLPSNEGRGYVLRRIMRRGMRHSHLLGSKDPVFHNIFKTLLNEMSDSYPELDRAQSLIKETLKMEEEKFLVLLERGMKILNDEISKVDKVLPGEVAFKLYDTYGFPLDLTEDVLRESDKRVDIETFDKKMTEQRDKARASWIGSGDESEEKIWADLRSKEDATEFLGYEREKSHGLISKIIKDGKYIEKLSQDEAGLIVMNQTCFYGESGGQVGDQGQIRGISGLGKVTDTKRVGKIFVHFIEVQKGYFEVGNNLEQIINIDLRLDIKRNHSGTHLVHEALRRIGNKLIVGVETSAIVGSLPTVFKGVREGLKGTTALTRTVGEATGLDRPCLLYTSPSPRDRTRARMPSSA